MSHVFDVVYFDNADAAAFLAYAEGMVEEPILRRLTMDIAEAYDTALEDALAELAEDDRSRSLTDASQHFGLGFHFGQLLVGCGRCGVLELPREAFH